MPYHITPPCDRFTQMDPWFLKSIREWPLTREDMLDFIGIEDKVVAEIGVWKGYFARRMADRNPAELHLIDIWKHIDAGTGNWHDQVTKNPEGNMESARVLTEHARDVRFHQGESLRVVQTMPDNYFDMIYVDGNHYYNGCLGDITEWWKKLKPGGWMTGHDWNCRATDHGPRRAVKRFLKTHNLTLELLTGDLPMSWGFRKPEGPRS